MQPGRTCGGVTQDLPGIALAGWGIGQGPVRDDVRNLVLEMGMAHAQGAEDPVLAKDPQALPGGASYDFREQARSEERRAGGGWGSTCKSGGAPYHENKK